MARTHSGDDTPCLSPMLLTGWALALLGLYFVLRLDLMLALFAMLLVHQLIRLLALRLSNRLSRGSHALALALLATGVVAALTPVVLTAIAWIARVGEHLPQLEQNLQVMLEQAHAQLPQLLRGYLPNDLTHIRASITDWLGEHVNELRLAGQTAAGTMVHVIIGMVLGGLMAFSERWQPERMRPLSRSLSRRATLLAESFRRVVFAQVRISALNTVFTGIFLILVLPAFGVHLPLVKTLIVLTFVAGLLPVVGNLISNAVLFMVGLSVSLHAGIAALVFLVLIHKLEYFLNARIVGGRIHASAWELLAAMLLMEAAFGIAGLVAAPVYYAYIKRELSEAGLV